MLRATQLVALLGLSTLVAQAPGALAAEPYQREGSVEIGLQMGGHFFLDEDAVPFDADNAYPEAMESTFAYTLTGAYNFTRMFGLELGLQLTPAEVNRLSIFSVHLDLLFHPISHEWFVPFFGVGPSFSLLIPQDDAFSNDADPALNVMAGMKIFPWETFGFRIDLRYLLRFATAGDAPGGRSEVTGHDLIFSIGLLVNFGGEGEPPAPILLDTDGDGILDNADACPTVPGVASANGCPDRDGDSIVDSADSCPDVFGPAEYNGCPDTDGDTIVDKDDRCPELPGPVALQGCPDTDSDAIADLDDMCPKVPGVPAYKGCPPPPEDVVKKFSGKIEGITFGLDSDVIRESSFPTLDEAVAIMKEYPQLNIAIEGHTSSEGTREHNIDLSQRRAASVKTYMVDKGIAAERIETAGFGPDKPVESNDTKKGREANRRIEFRIILAE